MKEDSTFKCQTCVDQRTDVADCSGAELNGQSLEIVEKFYYLGDTMRARGGTFDSDITRTRSGLCKLKDLVLLLSRRSLPLEAKTDYILHVYVVLCFMEVRLGQIKSNM